MKLHSIRFPYRQLNKNFEYKAFMELSKDKEDKATYKSLYKEDENCYIHLHNKFFGK